MRRQAGLTDDDARFVEGIYRKNYKHMLLALNRFELDAHEREDIISATVISLMNKVEVLRGIPPDEQGYYIAKSTAFTAINHLKKQSADNRLTDKYLSVDGAEMPFSDAEERAILNIELSRVIESVMALPEKESLCIRMKRIYGYSDAEIAKAANLSESSVNRYVTRADKKLRNALRENKEGSDDG